MKGWSSNRTQHCFNLNWGVSLMLGGKLSIITKPQYNNKMITILPKISRNNIDIIVFFSTNSQQNVRLELRKGTYI